MTYREKILEQLSLSHGYTCAELVTMVKVHYPEDREKSRKQLMSTISGMIYNMMNEDILCIFPYKKGPRGGMVYKLNKED